MFEAEEDQVVDLPVEDRDFERSIESDMDVEDTESKNNKQ